MPAAPQQTDPRREHLRQQALQRRQAVLDRIVATRTLVIGGAVAVSCILAGYLDASAHPRTTSSAGSGLSSAFGRTSSGYYDNGGSAQGQFGGGSPPSASAGSGSAVSGGS